MVLQKTVRILPIILLAVTIVLSTASSNRSVTIYFNGGCSSCIQYAERLEHALRSVGIMDIAKRDYYTNRTELSVLASLRERLGVPQELAGSVTTIVDGRYVFEGFFPVDIIVSFIDSSPNSNRFIAAQGLRPNTYRVYNGNSILECDSSQNVSDCLSSGLFGNLGIWTVLLISGFVNGLNPCAFAVLAYFMGVVSVHRSRKEILKIGSFYVLSIYLVYLGIGFGLTQVIISSRYVQAISRFLGGSIIAVAIANLWGTLKHDSKLLPKIPRRLILPITRRFSRSWIQKSAVVAALLFGGIVAALEFPCTGGVYTGIIGMLSLRTDLTPILYLLGYNFMFVMPLIILLMLSYRIVNFPSLIEAVRTHRLLSRLASVALMLGLGVLLLVG